MKLVPAASPAGVEELRNTYWLDRNLWGGDGSGYSFLTSLKKTVGSRELTLEIVFSTRLSQYQLRVRGPRPSLAPREIRAVDLPHIMAVLSHATLRLDDAGALCIDPSTFQVSSSAELAFWLHHAEKDDRQLGGLVRWAGQMLDHFKKSSRMLPQVEYIAPLAGAKQSSVRYRVFEEFDKKAYNPDINDALRIGLGQALTVTEPLDRKIIMETVNKLAVELPTIPRIETQLPYLLASYRALSSLLLNLYDSGMHTLHKEDRAVLLEVLQKGYRRHDQPYTVWGKIKRISHDRRRLLDSDLSYYCALAKQTVLRLKSDGTKRHEAGSRVASVLPAMLSTVASGVSGNAAGAIRAANAAGSGVRTAKQAVNVNPKPHRWFLYVRSYERMLLGAMEMGSTDLFNRFRDHARSINVHKRDNKSYRFCYYRVAQLLEKTILRTHALIGDTETSKARKDNLCTVHEYACNMLERMWLVPREYSRSLFVLEQVSRSLGVVLEYYPKAKQDVLRDTEYGPIKIPPNVDDIPAETVKALQSQDDDDDNGINGAPHD